ncbi:MAG: SGNH/GDSL hydrolase family protein [Gemmatimonadales bacterium]
MAVAAASGLTGGLGALSGLMAQPRPLRSGSRFATVTGQSRPFNMVCLGDSIMWGQGLRDSNKFTAQVESWLKSRLAGRGVNRYVYARSGATIGPDQEIPDQSRVEPWMNDRNLGEVPCSWPWVGQQVSVARADLASRQVSTDAVDLVLVDGGANDVGIKTLLYEFNTADLVRQKSTELIGGQMPDLLNLVRGAFPHAKILVTGYYPIISEQSDLGFISGLVSLVIPAPVAVALAADARSRLAVLSQAWYEASNSQLSQAVAAFNSKWPVNPTYRTPPAAFARISWGPEHSYAAPSSRLWLVGAPVDEVYSERSSACNAAGLLWNQHQVEQGKNITCLEAKAGHPNPAGAAAYAAACQAELARYLAEWSGAKLMTACVEMDPMPAAGVSTTLTVRATGEGPAGPRPVPASVRIGAQTFATDTPIPLTLCTRSVSPADREEGKPLRPGVVRCTPITVSAAGYVDVVIRDYLKAQPLPR